MPSRAGTWPDWRDDEQYRPLLEADRSAFAWEWLRRNQDYGEDFEATLENPDRLANEERAARWGLHRLEPPHLSAVRARPMWRRDHYPYVLEVAAEQGGRPSDRFDLGRFRILASIYKASTGHEHLLLSDGRRSIRVDVVSGSLEAGPAWLHYQLAGLATLVGPLMALQRLVGLWKSGGFSPALHPREVRAARWLQMIRAHDALVAGATQREIAERLISREAGAPRWRVAAPTVRSRVQRLVRAARELAAGGYASLLE